MQSQKDSFTLAPIGHLRSVFDHKFGTPRQGALAPHSEARFILAPQWQGRGLFERLEGFSHVWLVSWFHQSKNTRVPCKIHPPRLLGESVGVMASRSPHRPNNLGLTLARLEKVEGEELLLSGIDLIDGTPILDIKPYLAEADRPQEYSGGWTENLAPSEMRCEFSATALSELDEQLRAGRVVERERFLHLVREVLLLDPRPLSYRERVNERFAIVLSGLDVHAVFSEGVFTVVSVQPFSPSKNEQREENASQGAGPQIQRTTQTEAIRAPAQAEMQNHHAE
jgi:tRNA-Thr(GGU) m(6)t(6)A37 methyltransferase TsaA